MRRFATTFLLLGFVACVAGVRPASAQQLLYDYVGFDYETPIVDPINFGGVGNGYVSVGEVPVIPAPLVVDQTNNEYTYVLTGLTASVRTVFGSFAVIEYTGPATLTLYEDSKTSGTAFDYGVNPPNGTAPPSFMDGTAILVGSITNFRIIYNLASGSGSFDSDFTVTGGTQYGNIPIGTLAGWQFAGLTQNSITIPQGYAHQVDGEVYLQPPSASRSSSWGNLKRSYR
jgi:hypothetical protein